MFDSHIHIVEKDIYQEDFSFNFDSLKEYMNTLNGAIVMPMITQFDNSYDINKDFFSKVQEFKNVYPFAFSHPKDVKKIVEDFKPSGIKLHPSISQFIPIEHIEMFEYIESKNLPILIHCGRGEKSRLKYILEVSSSVPDLKIIVAHLGGLATELILNSIKMMGENKYENIWFDTAGIFHPKLIEKMVKSVSISKIIYGTDIPFFDKKICEYVINSCNFSEMEKEKIFNDNISDLFN